MADLSAEAPETRRSKTARQSNPVLKVTSIHHGGMENGFGGSAVRDHLKADVVKTR